MCGNIQVWQATQPTNETGSETMTKIEMEVISGGSWGPEVKILTEPHATHFATVDGLRTATNNATFRGVKFGRKLQNRLSSTNLGQTTRVDWEQNGDVGRGTVEVADDVLADLATRAAEIERLIESAKPAAKTYQCAGDCCHARVAVRGGYCESCKFDA